MPPPTAGPHTCGARRAAWLAVLTLLATGTARAQGATVSDLEAAGIMSSAAPYAINQVGLAAGARFELAIL